MFRGKPLPLEWLYGLSIRICSRASPSPGTFSTLLDTACEPIQERERERRSTDKYFVTHISLLLGSSRYRKKKKKKRDRARLGLESQSISILRATANRERIYAYVRDQIARGVWYIRGTNFIAHTYIIARECLECYQVGGKTVRLKSAVSKFCGYPTRCTPQETRVATEKRIASV